MPWGRLDDRANANAKLLALSDAAWRMWGCGLIYCQFNLTNGFIEAHALLTFGVRARDKQKVAAELCRRLVEGKGPLWHRVKGGYQIHDYLDWNDSREKIKKDRLVARTRLERFRKRVSNGTRNGDRNALQTPLRTASERSSTTTTTGVSKNQKHTPARGSCFSGARLKVSKKQHQLIVDELGTTVGHLGLLELYERWDAELVSSGEEFDTLNYVRRRATEAADAMRRGGPLYAEPMNESGEDWFDECKRLHNLACNGRHGHATQMVIDRGRAEREGQPA